MKKTTASSQDQVCVYLPETANKELSCSAVLRGVFLSSSGFCDGQKQYHCSLSVIRQALFVGITVNFWKCSKSVFFFFFKALSQQR